MSSQQLPEQYRKEQLKAVLKDRLHFFLLEDGAVRGALCRATVMVNAMRDAHQLGIIETLVLGHAYVGATLMASNLKSGRDRLQVQIDCSGPIQGLRVEANALGEVRGYLKQIPIPMDKAPVDFDLSPFFGAGVLKVTRHLASARQPFTGQVILEYGNIAQDLANYHLVSEQVPTAFNLSVQFDASGAVLGAGGMLLQIMPGAKSGIGQRLEAMIGELPSIGRYFADDGDAEALVRQGFPTLQPKLLDHRRIEFYCPCNQERLRRVLMLLPEDELLDIKENGPFPVELRCHNCNDSYVFDAAAIEEIYGMRRPDN